MLLTLLLTFLTLARADSVRVVWDGAAEAVRYELQLARDAKYTDGVETFTLEHATAAVSRPGLPKFARIRPWFADGSAGQWLALRSGTWSEPKLAASFRVRDPKRNPPEISWKAPAEAGKARLTYRVTLTGADGIVLQDSLIERTAIRLPPLPGGEFELAVEAVGDSLAGTIHLEGEKVARAKIEAEAAPSSRNQRK